MKKEEKKNRRKEKEKLFTHTKEVKESKAKLFGQN